MRAVKSSDWHIEHQCPQCGAPAMLLECDRLFVCPYCRVTSCLLTQGVAQYRLPSKSPKDARELIYFPYWRFKGMLLSCLPGGVHPHFIDTSHQACRSPCFPATLGLRSQAMILSPVTSESPGHFIRPQLPLGEVMPIFNRRFIQGLDQPPLHQAHIGESVSLIYAPFYLLEGALIDAVLDRPTRGGKSSAFRIDDYPGGSPATRVQFLPTLCPRCGWDLEGRRDARVLNCPHCHSLWQPGHSGFTSVPCAHVPAAGADDAYLPFWRIRAEVGGVPLSSYADLMRLANLPKVIHSSWEEMPYRFWSPAFNVRPRTFLRLMRRLSIAPPPPRLEKGPPARHLPTVSLPLSEALETLKPHLASLIQPPARMTAVLPGIRIAPRGAVLVFLPFEERARELVSSALNLAVDRHQLDPAWNR